MIKKIPHRFRREDGSRGRVSQFFPELNIAALARHLNYSEAYVNNVLHGKRNGTTRFLMGCSKALGMRIEDLVRVQENVQKELRA